MRNLETQLSAAEAFSAATRRHRDHRLMITIYCAREIGQGKSTKVPDFCSCGSVLTELRQEKRNWMRGDGVQHFLEEDAGFGLADIAGAYGQQEAQGEGS
jgi:hypothetical protein